MSLGKADHRESAVSIISAEGDILSIRLIIVDVGLDHLTKVVFFIRQFLSFFFLLFMSVAEEAATSQFPVSAKQQLQKQSLH